jgi:hypothetical protein
MKFYFSILMFFIAFEANAQSNPGYLGKHHSIGAFVQCTPFFKEKRYLTPTFKIEQTIHRHLSIEGSFGFFSKTFTPDLLGDGLIFQRDVGSTYNQAYHVDRITGTAKFKGFQNQLAAVFYLRKFGAMAPYGKRFSAGYFLNSSTIIEDNLTYYCSAPNPGANTTEALTVKPQNGNYKSKNISGIYLEIGEKRVSSKNMYLQYSLQLTIPLSYNYADKPTDSYSFENNQDYVEVKMRQSIIRNNLLSAFLGIGFLLK